MLTNSNVAVTPVQDVADFYMRWPSLRVHMASILDRSDLREEEREVLTWLQVLADRIGPADLN